MKKKFFIFIITCFLCLSNIHAQLLGPIVYDPKVDNSIITQFLTTVDELYQMYDQTMNQIEMIQQNYERLQFFIDQAATFNFEEIQWDGDLDFRNEIKNATRQVNKQLNNIRGVRDTLNAKTITIGNNSFSFKSLCGIKDNNNGNIVDLVKAGVDFYANGFAKAASVWAEGVPEKDAQMLWARYGLSPANYKMVKDVEDKLSEKIVYLIGSTEEDIKEQQKADAEFYQTIENIMDMMGNQGATEPELLQINGMLQEQTIFALKSMQEDLKQGMSYLVWYDVYEKQKAESENQSKLEKMAEAEKNSVSDLF